MPEKLPPLKCLAVAKEILPRSFYARDTVTVARELLGGILVKALLYHRILAGLVNQDFTLE